MLTLGSSPLSSDNRRNKIASERHTCAVLDKGVGERGHFIRRSKWEAMCNGEMGEAEDRGLHDRTAGGVAMAAS